VVTIDFAARCVAPISSSVGTGRLAGLDIFQCASSRRFQAKDIVFHGAWKILGRIKEENYCKIRHVGESAASDSDNRFLRLRKTKSSLRQGYLQS
jgi:hypothetical protein